MSSKIDLLYNNLVSIDIEYPVTLPSRFNRTILDPNEISPH